MTTATKQTWTLQHKTTGRWISLFQSDDRGRLERVLGEDTQFTQRRIVRMKRNPEHTTWDSMGRTRRCGVPQWT